MSDKRLFSTSKIGKITSNYFVVARRYLAISRPRKVFIARQGVGGAWRACLIFSAPLLRSSAYTRIVRNNGRGSEPGNA